MKSSLFDRFSASLRELPVRPGDRILAAVSGGADSMALLSLLLQSREEWNFSLFAAHVNHGLREAASGDEKLVTEFCRQNAVPLSVLHADVAAQAAAGESEELCGRRLRYEFFDRCSENGWIVTAHTADDNLETVLLNLTRGTALRGLCGIPPVRDRILRPLLFASHENTVDFCRQERIPFAEDETNAGNAYRRNRLRHAVVPVLREENPAVSDAVTRMTAANRDDEALLSRLTDELLARAARKGGYDAQVLLDADRALCRRAVARIAGRGAEYRHIDEICAALANQSGAVTLPGEATAAVKKTEEGILLALSARPDRPWTPILPFFAGEGEYNLGNGRSLRLVSEPEFQKTMLSVGKINNLLLNDFLDCDKLYGELTVRSRLPGDFIRPAGRGCTKSLKKLYNELHFPPGHRNGLVVASDGRGVVFAEGAGICERCAVNEQTVHALQFIITEEIAQHA